MNYFADYLGHIRGFSTNARLYLWSCALSSAAQGLYYVVFNLYLLRVGLDENFLGKLVFFTSMAGVVFALPAGRLSDTIGRRRAFLASGVVAVFGLLAQVLLPNPVILLVAGVVTGAAWTVGMVTAAPLLVESSRTEERAHLFGFQSALVMGATVVGSNLGGVLPRFLGHLAATGPETTVALRGTLVAGVVLWLAALLPLFRLAEGERIAGGPVEVAGRLSWLRFSSPRLTALILIPTIVTSFGAGMIMPLQNVFMDRHLGATAAQIGLIFSLGSLLTGIGSLVAPLLAVKWGKVRAATLSQFLSLPFLALMGLIPHLGVYAVASLIRCALMNLANPLITSFQMEIISARERATVNGLINLCWNLGWAAAGWAGGWVMQNVSYTLPYGVTFCLYTAGIALFYSFFKSFEPAPGRPPVLPVAPELSRRKARQTGE